MIEQRAGLFPRGLGRRKERYCRFWLKCFGTYVQTQQLREFIIKQSQTQVYAWFCACSRENLF